MATNGPRVSASGPITRTLAAFAAAAVVLALALPVLAAQVDVGLAGKAFDPARVTAHPGDTVVWTVSGAIGEPHSVTSGRPGDADAGERFDSGIELTENGDRFEFTFQEPGAFPYYCIVHPAEMLGEVVVEAAGAAPGGHGGPISLERRLLAVGILVAFVGLMVVWAWLYKRVNRA